MIQRESLVRVASLAAQILTTLRQPGRGVYESERQLRAWVNADGIQHSAGDIGPALTLLESTGRIERPPVKVNTPRRGWLVNGHQKAVEDAPEDTVDEAENAVADAADGGRIHALSVAVIRALTPGNGRSHRCPVSELPERLAADGVDFDPGELGEVITRLWDCGQLIRVNRSGAQFVVASDDHPLDHVDVLAGLVCRSIKARGDQFESDEQLCSWLEEDGVHYTSDSLSAAMHHLERIGRLRRPIVEHTWANEPQPGIYVDPRVYFERSVP